MCYEFESTHVIKQYRRLDDGVLYNLSFRVLIACSSEYLLVRAKAVDEPCEPILCGRL
jgi:hypothetical protein